MAESAKVKGGVKGVFAKVTKSFRDMRGEMKRVVWPSRKQTINNTAIVLVFMAVMAVIIGVFDTVLTTLIRLFFGMGS
jgi:preprotein translocase subunit SecE